MQIVKFGQQLNTPIVLCLGYFETMHIGHRALLSQARQLADKHNCKVALFTFDRKNQSEVYTIDERMDLYRQAGIDYVICADFTPSFKQTSGAEFVATLFACMNIRALVCGTDYTFGCDHCGAFEMTFLVGGRCPLFVVKPIVSGNAKVSSTMVRSLLEQNDLATANKLLGQPYFVKGTVCHGRGVGKTIGFPTANIEVPLQKVLPHGVFGGNVVIDDNKYLVVINIGGKPTFNVESTTIEVYVIDYDDDLYGRQLSVNLTDYLRPTTAFDGVERLVAQLQTDVAKVKELYDDKIRS